MCDNFQREYKAFAGDVMTKLAPVTARVLSERSALVVVFCGRCIGRLSRTTATYTWLARFETIRTYRRISVKVDTSHPAGSPFSVGIPCTAVSFELLDSLQIHLGLPRTRVADEIQTHPATPSVGHAEAFGGLRECMMPHNAHGKQQSRRIVE